jgi:hypothetical protein
MLSGEQRKSWKAVPNNVRIGAVEFAYSHICKFAHYISFGYGSVHYYHSAL